MAGFLDSCKVKFQDVALVADDGVPTAPFLDACQEIIALLDILGSTAFAPVKSDIGGNIKRLRTRLAEKPQLTTLQALVDAEIAEGQHKHSKSCALGLLWLKRAIEFIEAFLCEVQSSTGENMTACATAAYGKTLKQFHNFMVRGIFSMAARAVPYRKDFIQHVGGPSRTPAEVGVAVQAYTDGMRVHLAVLDAYCKAKDIK